MFTLSLDSSPFNFVALLVSFHTLMAFLTLIAKAKESLSFSPRGVDLDIKVTINGHRKKIALQPSEIDSHRT